MTKEHLQHFASALILLLMQVLVLYLWKWKLLETYPLTACSILGIGMAHSLVKPILCNFNLSKVLTIVNVVAFSALSATLLYLENWTDLPLFIVTMGVLLKSITAMQALKRYLKKSEVSNSCMLFLSITIVISS